jgi:hypothetical protein
MAASVGFWVRHFEAYLRVERVLSDLFTIAVLVGVLWALAVIVWQAPLRSRTKMMGWTAMAVLLLVSAGGYIVVGAQFRHECLRADDALARALPTYPGGRVVATSTWADYDSGDSPPRACLAFTRRFPRAWNYARLVDIIVPPGTTTSRVRRFYAARLRGWTPNGEPGKLPESWSRGGQGLEVEAGPWPGRTLVDHFTLIVNGWSRFLE